MSTNGRTGEPFIARFVEAEPNNFFELMNTTELTLKCVEILTVFLKDEETPGGGPSRAHIKFEAVKSIQPKERVVLSHRTWIDGRPTESRRDELERLKVVEGGARPYVLDISWEDAEGKSRYQRIPVGH